MDKKRGRPVAEVIYVRVKRDKFFCGVYGVGAFVEGVDFHFMHDMNETAGISSFVILSVAKDLLRYTFELVRRECLFKILRCAQDDKKPGGAQHVHPLI